MSGPQSSARQSAIWRLEALGYDLLSGLLRALPVDMASAFGGGIVRRLGPLISHNRLVHRNLRLAFPDLGLGERERIASAQWENFGRYIAEMFFMDRLTPVQRPGLDSGGNDSLRALESGRPTVHLMKLAPTWRWMSSAILAMGVDCVITGRALNNPYIDARLLKSRRRYGVVAFAPKGASGARQQLQALKRGQSVAHMIDQKNNQGVAGLFFGHLANTESSAAKMALKSGAALLPISVQRLKGARFRVVVHEPITVSADRPSAGRPRGRRAPDQRPSWKPRVRERPEEWWWSHKRWANEVYAGMEA